jgi:hypothetical protein
MKMNREILTAIVVTAGLLVLWQSTGGDYYTKYEVIEEVPIELEPDDPLAAAGFYDDNATQHTRRDAFRFGLLPGAPALLDKHVVSVVTIVVPYWAAVAALTLWRTRKRHSK